VIDPDAAARIHPNDIPKIIRSLEVFDLTGQTISSCQAEHRFRQVRRPFLMIGLRIERERLYERIERRVEAMIESGWIDEVRRLAEAGFHGSLPAMGSLGYRHLFYYLNGKCRLDEAVGRIKQETRNYAKRQMTWFNGDENVHWIDPENHDRGSESLRILIDRFRQGVS